MDWFTNFIVCLLIGLTCTAPTEEPNKTENEKYVIYRADYDIDSILFPINMINQKDNSDETPSPKPIIFFALADYKNGERTDKGFYIRKDEKVTKLLDHGRDAATANDGMSAVYIAASDGIYVYDIKNNKMEKYGAVTDDIIGIAKINGSDVIYILTKDREVYKITEQGMKKDKVVEIDRAEQIVLDYENNLYYITNNHVNILGPNGIIKVTSLPETISTMKLIKPPIAISYGVPIAVDNNVYFIFANGSSSFINSIIGDRTPTAYSIEGTLIFYVGSNKKIYEYNVVAIIFSEIFKQVANKIKSFFDNLNTTLRSLGS